VFTAKDGFPLSINATTNNTNSFGGNQRPNIVGDPHLSHPTITEWFNIAAFAQPPAFTFGNAPRTMPNLRAPGEFNWDSTIQKNFPIAGEKSRLQIRGEFYNFLNRANFYAPNTTFGNPSFGIISGTLPARSIQLGARYDW
jgi:hypothetical protein